MKIFKVITVFSDGSLSFFLERGISLTNKLVIFQKQDDRNFSFNQKQGRILVDSKQFSYYKKKYLK